MLVPAKVCLSHLQLLRPEQAASQPQLPVWSIERNQNHELVFLHPDINQSTFLRGQESFACTFIALEMAKLFCVCNNAAVNEPLSGLELLEIISCSAILVGNSEYDRMANAYGYQTPYSVEKAIKCMANPDDVIVTTCEKMIAPISFTNENAQEPQSLSYYLGYLPNLAPNIAALVITNHMTICFVSQGRKLFALDGHFHFFHGGAMIGVSDMSGIESFLANIKKKLSLTNNSCSVTFVEFSVTEDRFLHMLSQQKVSSDLLGVLDACLEKSGNPKKLIDNDYHSLSEEIYKLGHTRLITMFLTLKELWVSRASQKYSLNSHEN